MNVFETHSRIVNDYATLGLTSDGVITLQYALKRAAESVFQVEPNEIGGVSMGDPESPNMDGLYVQPDFYYESRIWVFCDGTPHDDPTVRADDDSKRQAIIARGDEVWVYYYKDNLLEKVAARPDIFRKVR